MKPQFYHGIFKFLKDVLYHLEYYYIYAFRKIIFHVVHCIMTFLMYEVSVSPRHFQVCEGLPVSYGILWHLYIQRGYFLCSLLLYDFFFFRLNKQLAIWSVRNISQVVLFLHDIFKLFVSVITYCWLRMCWIQWKIFTKERKAIHSETECKEQTHEGGLDLNSV